MTQRIVYLSWPAGEISGGIKMAFRHVKVLREAGWDSVIATADARPPHWFESAAPVIDLAAVAPAEDVLVFPENDNALLQRFAAWPNRKVILCQNWCMAIRGLGERRDYAEFGVSRILCVDPYTADYCRLRFPAMRVEIAPVYVDHELFRFQSEKTLQIACSPRSAPWKRRSSATSSALGIRSSVPYTGSNSTD